MSKDLLLVEAGIYIFSDGTYRHKDWLKGNYSCWKIDNNVLFVDHQDNKGWLDCSDQNKACLFFKAREIHMQQQIDEALYEP